MLKIFKFKKFRLTRNQAKKINAKACLNKHSFIRITRLAIFLAIATLAATSLIQIILPVKPYQIQLLSAGIAPITKNTQKMEPKTQYRITNKIRKGLFKPSRRVNANSITDKTVEKIFKSLKLQSIMPMGDKKYAYIVLKDGQMRKCQIGDKIKDMFTVIDIQKDSVIIDILGHKLSLTR